MRQRLRKLIGTAAMNEYSAATVRLAPSSMPPMMVEAEREKLVDLLSQKDKLAQAIERVSNAG